MRFAAAVVVVILVGCSSTNDPGDPYDTFLANGGGDVWLAEIGEPMISREDAAIRASLIDDPAPETIDWYLDQAYN